MIKKTLSISLLSAAVLASIPMVAMAYHDGPGRPHGYYNYQNDDYRGRPALSEEQRAQMDKLCEEHRNAVRPLYDQLTQKGLELRALSPNPNVKPEELKAIIADISKLHEQLRTINEDFYSKMADAGLPCFGAYRHGGYHHGGNGWCGMPRHGQNYGCWR